MLRRRQQRDVKNTQLQSRESSYEATMTPKSPPTRANFHFHFPFFSHKQPQLKMNAVKEKGRKIGNEEEEEKWKFFFLRGGGWGFDKEFTQDEGALILLLCSFTQPLILLVRKTFLFSLNY